MFNIHAYIINSRGIQTAVIANDKITRCLHQVLRYSDSVHASDADEAVPRPPPEAAVGADWLAGGGDLTRVCARDADAPTPAPMIGLVGG